MTAILGVKNNPGAKMCRQDPFKQNRGNNKKIKGVLISYCSFLSIIKDYHLKYSQLRAKTKLQWCLNVYFRISQD